MRKRRSVARALALGLLASGLATPLEAQTASDLTNTKHNLSVSGPGPIRALTETRICVFCHTPHNATPLSPLWNKELEPQVYTVYTSPTLRAGLLPQPSGPTKLCLSCHDGTIAMGSVVNPAGGFVMAGGGTLPSDSLSNLGQDLSGHHPVSFRYSAALPNPQLASSPPPDLVFGGEDELHCTTCHDPHDDSNGRFLAKDNRYSALCTSCHQMTGWIGSAHAASNETVAGLLPRPPKTWPSYNQLNKWGCEICHTPHFAPTAEQLLNFTSAPPSPYSCITVGCHEYDPAHPPRGRLGPPPAPGKKKPAAPPNIGVQVRKPSAHHQEPAELTGVRREPGGAARSGTRSVGCPDCHNAHAAVRQNADAPLASGLLRAVSGIDRNGGQVAAVTYEYEVCFKCHADYTPDFPFIQRVVTNTNKRLAFDSTNPSYHPVLDPGQNLNIPSIPSSFEPEMTPAVMIFCTDCHSDDEGGSRGPHGSVFAPILRLRYETADNTPETVDNYALCYRCHDRNSILRDTSFQKKTPRSTASGGGHSGHLAAGAPCSACHDPHGVSNLIGTGSHTHLINFDRQIVQPKSGGTYPLFDDRGTFAGSCDLVCHGVSHDNLSYP